MTTEAGGTFRPGHGQPYPLHVEVGGFTPTEFLPGGGLCHSRYRAIATCCGREHLVTHRQLQQRERYGVERCGTCSRQAKAGTKRGPAIVLAPGQRFGLIEIVTVHDQDRATVRWTCCGRQEDLSRADILAERHLHRRRPWRRCSVCVAARRLRADYEPTRKSTNKEVDRLPPEMEVWYRLPVPAGLSRNLWGQPCSF